MSAPAAWWPPGSSPAVRVHRRVLRGYGRRRSRPGALVALVRDVTSWRRSGAEAALAEVSDASPRLRLLARYGVHPGEARTLGLDRDDRFPHWTEYVSGRHHYWNLAASGTGARREMNLLTDKWAAQAALSAHGIPVAPSVLLRAGRPASQVVGAFRAEHGSAFTKPNTGFARRGAHEAEADPPTPLEDLLLQPVLRSHPDFDGVADGRDVVTVRVVTREVGEVGARVFCALLELPRPIGYAGHVIDPDGAIGPQVRPSWLGPPPDSPLEAWRGRSLPDAAAALELAVRSHALVPRMFAVAWDFALTPDGPILLEGNTGFGILAPQWIAGGLLSGMR